MICAVPGCHKNATKGWVCGTHAISNLEAFLDGYAEERSKVEFLRMPAEEDDWRADLSLSRLPITAKWDPEGKIAKRSMRLSHAPRLLDRFSVAVSDPMDGFEESCDLSDYDATLSEIGDEFEIGRERVGQIIMKALRKLRHKSRAKFLKEFVEP